MPWHQASFLNLEEQPSWQLWLWLQPWSGSGLRLLTTILFSGSTNKNDWTITSRSKTVYLIDAVTIEGMSKVGNCKAGRSSRIQMKFRGPAILGEGKWQPLIFTSSFLPGLFLKDPSLLPSTFSYMHFLKSPHVVPFSFCTNALSGLTFCPRLWSFSTKVAFLLYAYPICAAP